MELGNIDTFDLESKYDEEYERYLEEGDEYNQEIELSEPLHDDIIDHSEEPEIGEEQLQLMNNSRGVPSRPNCSRVPNLSREEFGRLLRERKCLRCKKPGHFARDCKSSQPSSSNFNTQARGNQIRRQNLNQ